MSRIDDDWSDLDMYSVIHDSHNILKDNSALIVSTEYKQRYEQIYKGQVRQPQRITLDKLKCSKFHLTNL